MRRILSLAVVLSMALATFAQQNPYGQKFLNRYRNLLLRMTEESYTCKDSLHAWKLEKKSIKYDYRDTYRILMTDDEVRQYNSYNMQYKKRVAQLKLKKIGKGLSKTGSNVSDSFKRAGSKVSGSVEGLSR